MFEFEYDDTGGTVTIRVDASDAPLVMANELLSVLAELVGAHRMTVPAQAPPVSSEPPPEGFKTADGSPYTGPPSGGASVPPPVTGPLRELLDRKDEDDPEWRPPAGVEEPALALARWRVRPKPPYRDRASWDVNARGPDGAVGTALRLFGPGSVPYKAAVTDQNPRWLCMPPLEAEYLGPPEVL